jgi:hypothetical protein
LQEIQSALFTYEIANTLWSRVVLRSTPAGRGKRGQFSRADGHSL